MIRRGIGAGADFAIVSEPTNLNVTIGNRGLRWLEVSVKGRASHAGRPHVGANAIHAAARIIRRTGASDLQGPPSLSLKFPIPACR